MTQPALTAPPAPVATAALPWFLWVLALGNLVVGTGAFVIGGMAEPMSATLGLSVSATGQLTTICALANAVKGEDRKPC